MSEAFTTSILSAAVSFSQPMGTYDPGQNVLDLIRLTNNYDHVMEITEIRFMAYTNNITYAASDLDRAVAGASNTNLDLLAAYSIQMQGDQFWVVPEWTPIDSICTDYSTGVAPFAAITFGEKQTPSRENSRPPYSTSNAIWVSTRRWIPPVPITLLPQSTLDTRIRQDQQSFITYAGLGSAYRAAALNTVWVEYIGRITDQPMPKRRQFPHVLFWQPTSLETSPPSPVGLQFGAGLGNQTTSSNQAMNFRNRTGIPIRVQRILARQYLTLNARTGIGGTTYTQLVGHDSLRQVPDALNVNIKDSTHYDVAVGSQNGLVPFGTLIDPQRSAWTYNRPLDPWGFYPIEVTANNSDTDYQNGLQNVLPRVSIIGVAERSTWD